jgi:hypothetical protein
MRILLVEDDSMIAQAVVGSLKDDGYAVDWVNNGNTAETTLAGQNYNIILLDLGLPGQDGIQVLQHARASRNATPILILTARDDIQSRLAGLDGGADDYIIKPFIMAELKARIRAILRRHAGQASPLLRNGSIQLNPQTYQTTLEGQPESIPLSQKEFAVLQALMSRAGIILSRSELEDKIYGWGEEVESNAIDFLIHSLRKKIGKEHIKNIRGVGWMMPKAE